MSQNFTGMANRRQAPGFPPRLSLAEDAERPVILQEAERLLAQFTRSPLPALGTRDRSVTHGHSLFRNEQTSSTWCTPRSESTVVVNAPIVPLPRPSSPTLSDTRSPPSLPPNAKHSPTKAQKPRLENIRKAAAPRHTEKPNVQRVQTPDHSTPPSYPINSKEPLCTRRPQTRMSSSGYSSASEPASSLDSSHTLAVRRSARAKSRPATYNVRILSHLDQQESGLASSENEDPPLQVSGSPSNSPFPVANQAEQGPWHGTPSIRKLLFDREMGRSRQPHDYIRASLSSNIKPWRTWMGASNDVNVVAWSPDGTKFAAGATTQTDYNRPTNLMFGDLALNSLTELPDHSVPNPDPSPFADPRLFTSMSAMQWVDQRLYTANYDRTVKIWDVGTQQRPSCLRTLQHSSEVVVMALSSWMPHLLATGVRDGSFGLWDLRDEDPICKPLRIQRDPRQKTKVTLEPTTLAWGQTAQTRNLLVGGMQEQTSDNHKVALHGHLGMWKFEESSVTIRKLSPDSQNIFDIKWHPFLPQFVTGSTSSQALNLPRGSHSVVHVYGYNSSNDECTTISRLGCPAKDINELTLCPMNSAYVTASCTDGSTYVWDTRNPNRYLHKLRHGDSLVPLEDKVPRELCDCGVRVALWGGAMDQFYTGATDGCLKRWDIRRSPEDALVANVANFNHALNSGAFSEDLSHLVLGDYGGGIHVLSSAPWAYFEDDEFKVESTNDEVDSAQDPPAGRKGILAAQEFILENELVLHPLYGPVQGPNYQIPVAKWARGLPDDASNEKAKRTPLLPEYQCRQFDGPPLEDRDLKPHERRELEQHLNLIHRRHLLLTATGRQPVERKRKRKREPAHERHRGRHTEAEGVIQDVKRSRSLSLEAGDSYLTEKQRKKMQKEKRKRRKKRQPIITKIEDTVIDLTLSDQDSKGQSPLHEQDCHSPSIINSEEEEEEDYWWPGIGTVDANLPDECFV